MIAGRLMAGSGSQAKARSAAATAGAAARSRAGSAAARGADDDLLAFLQLSAQHLGGRPIADAEGDGEGLELLAVEHPDAAGRTAARITRTAAAGELVVARALLGREDLADAQAAGLA